MHKKIAPIERDDLSKAWAHAFTETVNSPGGKLSRLIVTIHLRDGVIVETPEIKQLLEAALLARDQCKVDTVASTIFPKSQWNSKESAQKLYDRYEKTWLYVQKRHANRNGVYFRRLTAFDNSKDPTKPVNQLDHIIKTWRDHKNHRHSALQAAIFDPSKDHGHSQQRGFPCLQQVAFDAQGANGKQGLVVTGFYATQTLFEKAYGNYLGLAQLGLFMAHELGLQLAEVTCIASLAKSSGNYGIGELRPLAEQLKPYLQ